jgi:G3E family GTPase
MRTTVVCGLLGSGKTTFIRNFLHERHERSVVLVNDFGRMGIDGEILSAGGVKAIELPSGCVCCTLKFDLITTVQRIVKQFSPEHLVIEPSGVASPSAVLEAMESAGIGGASVIGIVDAAEFSELYESGMYGSFFQDQIQNSDVILVNKTDLAERAAVDAAEHMIGSINPRAVLLRTVNAVMNLPIPEAPLQRVVRPGACHFHFETLSFRFGSGMDLVSFTAFFEDLTQGTYGAVARAKALVSTQEGPYRFDGTYGTVDRVRFERDIVDSRLVVIGEGLDKSALEEAVGAR